MAHCPERQPVACLLKTEAGSYRFPAVAGGQYYVFSVALPWNAGSTDLLTLDGAYRGRSAQVSTGKSRQGDNADIALLPYDDLHPPILAALPILVTRKLTGQDEPVPPDCEQAMTVVGI